MKTIEQVDPEVAQLLKDEIKRQQGTINLIASENFVSEAVLEASSSVLTNKYSEGYPGKRYYAGNEVVDKIENLAIERAKKLFGADHVNVQPYSGSPANMEIYFALLETGDKIMALDLAQGGHLTHGSKVNFSGKTYEFIPYGVNKETEELDYEELKELAIKEKPKLIVCGYTAYPRTVRFDKFAEIAKEVGAILMADISHISGLIVSGAHPAPFPHVDVAMTTTHKTLRGPRGAIILCKEEYAKKIDKAVFPGNQGGPHNHTTAAKAVAFLEAMSPEFKEYGHNIVKNAKALANALSEEGFRIVSGGTDNHLMLVDLTPKNVTGKEAQIGLEKAGIVCNMNMIPYDTRTPFNPSGIRLGTASLTTRKMQEEDMKQVAKFISQAIDSITDDVKLEQIKNDVASYMKKFPLYEDL